MFANKLVQRGAIRRSTQLQCRYLMLPEYGCDGHIADCQILECNEQAALLYGKTRAQVVGSRLSTYYHEYQFRTLMEVYELALALGMYEDRIQVPSAGSVYLEWARRHFARSGGGCIAVTLTDIGVERSHANELSRLTYHDCLTGLRNRAWLMETLPDIVTGADGSGVLMAMLDVDDFTGLNNTIGLPGGDAVLRWLGQRLQSCLPARASVARVGADEYTVVAQLSTRHSPAQFMGALREAISGKPCPTTGTSLSASIGISRYPDDAASAAELVSHAELALQAARHAGKGGEVQFGPMLSQRLQLGADLRRALRAQGASGLYLDYQPRVGIGSGCLVSMEALARWRHPTRGLVPPCEFIPLAEQRGMIGELGFLLFELACRQIASWRRAGVPLVPVSVNVSPLQLHQPDLRDQLLDCMARHAVPPELIELEITESAMLGEHPVVLEQLARLRAAGIRLAMDDFGVGYSSLSQLKHLALDVLKIDREFTADLSGSGHGRIFINAIIAMAHALDMRVVAEGVETAEQLSALRALGCDEAQGYLLSRPVAPETMADFMHQRHMDTSVAMAVAGAAVFDFVPRRAPAARVAG